MAINIVRRLTSGLYSSYVGRKGAGIISLVINTRTKEIMLVPQELEHIQFAAKILGGSVEEIVQNPSIAEHLVPVILETEEQPGDPVPKVIGIATGTSGMELGYGVRHTISDLELAHKIALDFASRGDLSIDLRKSVIVKRFVKK